MNISLAFLTLVIAANGFDQKGILENVKNIAQNLMTSSYDGDTTTLQKIRNIPLKAIKDDTICKSCAVVMDHLISYRRSGANRDSMVKYFKNTCLKFTDWGVVACNGYVEIEIDTVLFIIDNKRNLTPERVCAIHLQMHKCVDPDAEKWTVNIPPMEVDILEDKNETDNEEKPLRILHLTDIHYDPDYTPGSNAVCDEPLCCESGIPNDPANASGYWGDYHVCDMPWHSVLDLLSEVKQEKYDFVYFTGDIISHRSWTTSKEKNTDSIKIVYKLFANHFKNTTVYAILGNHEPHPTDFYSPETLSRTRISTQWVFDLVADEWARWLPSTTTDTIKKGGYYTILVKPGFRIVALNSNVCFTSNLWLIYEDKDPNEQLQWLVDVLVESEKNKEKVHILSHIPPGEINCHKQWSNQFRRVVERFSKTIVAQFNGHTHYDEIRIFYNSSQPGEVINVAFNGGSFTTFVGLNPNYRTYSVDANSYNVVDYETYTYNLTNANNQLNVTGEPKWFKLYSFKQAYGLDSIDSKQLSTFVDILRRNTASLKEYYKFSVRNSDALMKQGCDENCLKTLKCSITAVETNESVDC